MAYRPGKCRLHHILRENKFTLGDLSKLCGIRITQLSDYAYNRRTMSLSNAYTVAYALGIPIEDLYQWEQ